jgi:4-hydroxy-tetrahydrodipicolinate reductase
MIKVAVAGAKGRMGSLIARMVVEDPELKLVGVTELKERFSPGEVFAEGVRFCTGLKEMEEKPQVVVDFTTPAGTMSLLEEARLLSTALVVGTTGFERGELERLKEVAEAVPVVYSPNMSVGVNLLFSLTAYAVKALRGLECDVEIFEAHHRFKKDLPSGTALRLAEIVAQGFGVDPESAVVYRSRSKNSIRKSGEIGVMSARMGDVPGEHTVYLALPGERIELTTGQVVERYLQGVHCLQSSGLPANRRGFTPCLMCWGSNSLLSDKEHP